MKFNEQNLKNYIALKIQLETLKNSDLFRTDLKQYINKSIDLQTQLGKIKL
mgnify:CR=1 FL=1